jgi:hypothetical protein
MTSAIEIPKRPTFHIGDVILWVRAHMHTTLPETTYPCVTCECDRKVEFPAYTVWGVYGPNKIVATVTTETRMGKTVSYQVEEIADDSFRGVGGISEVVTLKEDYIFKDFDSAVAEIRKVNEEWQGELDRIQKLTLQNIKLPEDYHDGRLW